MQKHAQISGNYKKPQQETSSEDMASHNSSLTGSVVVFNTKLIIIYSLVCQGMKKANELIRSFCKEWNVGYHEADMVDGTVEVLKHLNDVSNDFVREFVEDGPAM